MKRIMLVLISGVILFPWGCKNPFTPKEKNLPQQPDYTASHIKEPVHPDSVISNFFYIYDFQENNIEVELAIEEYENCFVEDDGGFQYQFKYWKDGGTTLDFMSFDDEMLATASMFRKIANDGLYFDMVNFSQLKHTIEEGTDTSQHVHPHEDWHVYRMAVTFFIDNPNGGLMFKVDGDVEFYIRKCSDNYYRIVRWIDYTHEGIGSGKRAKMVTRYY
jgi:hypothetical protein